MYLQETNLKALELLARFKYLSTSQFIKLGLASSQPAVSRILQRFFKAKKEKDESEAKLIKSPLINKLTFPLDPKRGKLENLYCLNKRGATVLSEYLDKNINEIEYLKGNTFFAKDYAHRVTQIDYYIQLYLNSVEHNYSIDFFHSYYDKQGANRSNTSQTLEARTKLYYADGSYYIPDAIYKTTETISDGSQQEFYYVLEIHKNHDSKRAIETIEKNIKALDEYSLQKKYNYEYAHKVIVVFDTQTARDAVFRRFEKIDYYLEFGKLFELIIK
jgi:hypothetical protein